MSNANTRLESEETVQRILEARARVLVEPPRAAHAAESQSVIVVALGDERYGLPLHQVREVRALRALAAVPGTPASWAGLVNLRGRLYPVLDLARYLGLPVAETRSGQRVVVAAAAGLEVALLVDAVLGVREVPAADMRPLLAELAGARGALVQGVTPDLLALLNLDALLSDPQLVVQNEPA
jgi:purine-binding chemotaxis protein CheW